MAKTKVLLIPYAMDSATGSMVHVDKVPNGKLSGCVCPSCDKPLVAKNAGTQKAHHFAHASGAQRGACEGWLHATAKRLLYDRIARAIAEGDPVPIRWRCKDNSCSCDHAGDLVRRATSVHLEQRIAAANIRPDILLRMEGTNSRALVEIVHTHEPERPVFEYCVANDFPLLIFHIDKSEHLGERILAPTLEPQGVDNCRCPPCRRCGNVRQCDKDHRFCEQCGECVTDLRGSHGGYGDHGHCRYCKGLLEGKENSYAQHYHCWVRRQPPCPSGKYRHCEKCGKRIRMKDRDWKEEVWERCYSCHYPAKRNRTS